VFTSAARWRSAVGLLPMGPDGLVYLLGAGWRAYGAASAGRIGHSAHLGAMTGASQAPLSRVKTL